MHRPISCDIDGVQLKGCNVQGGQSRLLIVGNYGVTCYGIGAGDGGPLVRGKLPEVELLNFVPGISSNEYGVLSGKEAAVEILKSIYECRRIAPLNAIAIEVLDSAESKAMQILSNS